jgi:uncharacterized protein YbaR (Trm112 family)/SAM-dependent methyltransferase
VSLPLVICPGCRTLRDGRLDVRTMDRVGEVLTCECGRRYPIIDGVPIVLADPTGYFRNDAMTLVERDLPVAVAAALVETVPDDAPYARLLEHVSIYLDAHWGDRAAPVDGFALREVIDRLAGLPRVEHAAELGCSAGRLVAELAKTAEHVVGLDLQFGTVRRARKLLAGEPVEYGRRMIGRHYAPVRVTAGDLATDRVTLLCGDALDPPLLPRSYQRVVAINLLDSVANPQQLLSVLDGMCERGGELILSSPYSWQSSVMAEHHRLGGADPAATVRGRLTGGIDLTARYEIVEDAELGWPLRRDARSTLTYRIHYLRARKM